MQNLLETLWYSDLTENPIEMSEEKKRLLHSLVEDEKALCASFSKEQKILFEKYESSSGDMRDICEKQAYISGIKFATKFIIEALCED